MLGGGDLPHAVDLDQVRHGPEPREGEEAPPDARRSRRTPARWPGSSPPGAAPGSRPAAARRHPFPGFTGAKPASSGRSRTTNQEATPKVADSAASATNTARQEAWVTAQASGAPASTAPRFPANMVAPFRVAKRLAGNQTAFTLRTAMKATETPTPTRVRPAAATSQAGAKREDERAGTGDERSGRQEPAGTHGVGQHAHRDLQHRVDVEVGGRERAQDRAGDVEGCGSGRPRCWPARCGGRRTGRSSPAPPPGRSAALDGTDHLPLRRRRTSTTHTRTRPAHPAHDAARRDRRRPGH